MKINSRDKNFIMGTKCVGILTKIYFPGTSAKYLIVNRDFQGDKLESWVNSPSNMLLFIPIHQC